MKKEAMDLSVKNNAVKSMNQTAMTGMFIMNLVLMAAYAIELVKGARELGSYLVVVALCLMPCVVSLCVYRRKPESFAIRWVFSVGFALLYGYVMFTTTTTLVFCYVIVAYVILMTYIDIKVLSGLGAWALLVNIAVIIKKVLAGGFVGDQVTEAEICIACLLMTGLFTMLALKKINQINQANIDRAEVERKQAEGILKNTLEVAVSMKESIKSSVEETDGLKVAIEDTQRAMESLTDSAKDGVIAIQIQKQNTETISANVGQVDVVVNSIVSEVHSAEGNLEKGNEIMKNLLHQVQVSGESGQMAAEKMEELKQNAAKMQTIMGLISNVANQTGLLALNASIEAARAGEAGKGFSVVASEISNLSSQTNAATGEINGLIVSIVNSIGAVTDAMERLLESSRLQNEYVDTTADNFEQIHNSTQSIFEQVSHLKETVGVVTNANEQVSEGVVNMESVTQKVMEEASETLQSCNTNLHSVAAVVELMELLKQNADKLQAD